MKKEQTGPSETEFYFTDGEMEDKTSEATCSQSQSKAVLAQLKFRTRLAPPRPLLKDCRSFWHHSLLNSIFKKLF